MPWFKLIYSITVYTKTLKWCIYEFHVLRLCIEKKNLLREKYQLAIFFGRNEVKTRLFLIWYFSNDPKRLFLVHSGSPCQTGKILWKQLILNYYHSALPKMSGILNLPYKAYAFLEIVQSAPITMGFNFTLVALWILLVSRATILVTSRWNRSHLSWIFSKFLTFTPDTFVLTYICPSPSAMLSQAYFEAVRRL